MEIIVLSPFLLTNKGIFPGDIFMKDGAYRKNSITFRWIHGCIMKQRCHTACCTCKTRTVKYEEKLR